MAENIPFDMSHGGPYLSYGVVSPVDSADLSFTTRAVFVGQAGNMKFETGAGDILTLSSLVAGTIYPFGNITKIFSGDTTAASLVALR